VVQNLILSAEPLTADNLPLLVAEQRAGCEQIGPVRSRLEHQTADDEEHPLLGLWKPLDVEEFRPGYGKTR